MTLSIQCQMCTKYKGMYNCTEYGDTPLKYYQGHTCPARISVKEED